MTGNFRTGALAALVAASTLLAGCNGLIRRWCIHIQGQGAIRQQNVQVDVVGVNRSEIDVWEGPSITEYWAENSQLRKDARDGGYLHEGKFELPDRYELTICEKDGVWKKWRARKVEYILVMFDTCTTAEGWRKRLPLPPRCWGGQTRKNRVEIGIMPSHISCLTVPESDCD